MSLDEVLAALAESGLPDDVYTAIADELRTASVRLSLADRLVSEACRVAVDLPASLVLAADDYLSSTSAVPVAA